MAERRTESEVLAQELEHIGHKIEPLEARVKVLEAVIPRLETAAERQLVPSKRSRHIGTRYIRRCVAQSRFKARHNFPARKPGARP